MALANLLDLAHYRVKAGSVDFRGWPVADTDGVEVGRVEDFIVDTEVLLARYVTLALHSMPRTVILPLARLSVDQTNRRLVLDGIAREQLMRLPYLGGEDLDEATLAEYGEGPDFNRGPVVCFWPGDEPQVPDWEIP